jgi:hypothetical protein
MKNKWIKCSEKLPEENTKVIFYPKDDEPLLLINYTLTTRARNIVFPAPSSNAGLKWMKLDKRLDKCFYILCICIYYYCYK